MSLESLTKTIDILSPEGTSIADVESLRCFRIRLRSFIEGQKWVSRPLMLSPAVCASFGWKCVSSELLECDTCSAKLSAGLPKAECYQAYKLCMEQIRSCLVTSHRKHCPWPIVPCPYSYTRMVPIHKEDAFMKFRGKLESLSTLGTYLPLIKNGTEQKLYLTDENRAAICNLSQVEDTNVNLSGIMLAATGWRREFEATQKRSISCYSCQRILSLSLYQNFNICARQSALSQPSDSASSQPSDSSPSQPSCSAFSPPRCSVSSEPDDSASTQPSCSATPPPSCSTSTQPSESTSSATRQESNGTTKHCRKEQDENSFEEVEQCESPAKRVAEDTESSEAASTESSGEPKRKKIKLLKKTITKFDPMSEHRSWCAWVVASGVRENGESDDDTKYYSSANTLWMPGWKLFMKCLLKNIPGMDEEHKPLQEKYNHAQKRLESWNTNLLPPF